MKNIIDQIHVLEKVKYIKYLCQELTGILHLVQELTDHENGSTEEKGKQMAQAVAVRFLD
jgi:hypothetical protein